MVEVYLFSIWTPGSNDLTSFTPRSPVSRSSIFVEFKHFRFHPTRNRTNDRFSRGYYVFFVVQRCIFFIWNPIEFTGQWIGTYGIIKLPIICISFSSSSLVMGQVGPHFLPLLKFSCLTYNWGRGRDWCKDWSNTSFLSSSKKDRTGGAILIFSLICSHKLS